MGRLSMEEAVVIFREALDVRSSSRGHRHPLGVRCKILCSQQSRVPQHKCGKEISSVSSSPCIRFERQGWEELENDTKSLEQATFAASNRKVLLRIERLPFIVDRWTTKQSKLP